MQISRRDSDGFILQAGIGLGALDGSTVFDVSSAMYQQVMNGLQNGLILLPSGTLQNAPVVPRQPSDPSPDIRGIIAALLNSASLDQATKTALIAALRGQ